MIFGLPKEMDPKLSTIGPHLIVSENPHFFIHFARVPSRSAIFDKAINQHTSFTLAVVHGFQVTSEGSTGLSDIFISHQSEMILIECC